MSEALQDELASTMSPMGLHFDWRSLSAARGSEVAIELAAVNSKGKCEVARREPRNPRVVFRAGLQPYDQTMPVFADAFFALC